VLFIYYFFDFVEAVQNHQCSFYLHVWKCNGIETGLLSYCQNINEGLSFHSMIDWPRTSLSGAGRSVHKTSALSVFIRRSSRPPARLYII